jgi:hypothetical protein
LFALSTILRVPVRAPRAEGVKVTATTQLDLAAKVPPEIGQGLPTGAVALKSPEALILLMVRLVGRLLVTVTFLAVLVVLRA